MVFVKPTVGFTRFASTAFKSFSHGYSGALIAAAQSSNASQNNALGPQRHLSKLGKTEKGHHHNGAYSAAQPSGSSHVIGVDASQHDATLAQYYDAWQKHQKTGDVRDWQQFQFQKRIGYPVGKSGESREAAEARADDIEIDELNEEEQERVALKRSYTTSDVENLTRVLESQSAEASAFAHVNDAIAQEILKSKQEAEAAAGFVVEEEDVASEKTVTLSRPSSIETSTPESTQTVWTQSSEVSSSAYISEADALANQFEELVRTKQYAKIPGAFEGMLLSGVKQPSPMAYRALMTSAVELLSGKHQKVPKVLEVYSDMIRRRVVPDAETYSLLINLLAGRALEASATKEVLEQRANRYGGVANSGKFLFRSDELEYAIFSEDQSLHIALSAFHNASAKMTFSSESYCLMITACAKQGRIPDMIRLYEQMELKDVSPQSSIFPAMIGGFAAAGDLANAVECYEQYKKLAIANDAGLNAMSRVDTEVYAALVKAYAVCEHISGGQRFFGQVESEQPNQLKRQAIRDTIIVDAFLPVFLNAGKFAEAFELTKEVSPDASVRALNKISIVTADGDNLEASARSFNALVPTNTDLAPAAMAMLAMHIRNSNINAAEPYWRVLENSAASSAFIEPSTMRAVALISTGQAARGIYEARVMWSRIRASNDAELSENVERIEEAIEVLGRSALSSGQPIQIDTSVEMLRMMVENGGLVHPVAQHLVSSFGPQHITALAPADVCLLTKVQSRMILDEAAPETAGPARFACLLDNIVSRSILPDVSTENLIEKTLINIDRSELSRLWNSYRYPAASSFASLAYAPVTPFVPPPPPQAAKPTFDDSLDPYAGRTDNKGSVIITDLLEKPHGRSANQLQEALAKFRNIRRAGRHPRFYAYSKLITAAAKEHQLNLAHDILEMAKQDVPFNPNYRVVRYGWVTILDSMVAACLMAGRRELAAKYHQDLLEMGAAPSANTYGLYITTLKETTHTFDEATEAVKIFLRAKAEGVEPSSFLYNALIGKLGKARRIDDCLFYFAEMRNLGIKPTSVTYGTIVNALCRVSDEKFAEEIFEEMESCTNYKPRPAPYHSLMQYFLTTKRDRSKVLSYYDRMLAKGIQPTMHTYKLLIDTHATLEPLNMDAAKAVLEQMHAAGEHPEAVHYASLIHAKGCVQHDTTGARALFDQIIAEGRTRPQPCLYQALIESLVANRQVSDAEALLADMSARHVDMTPYIANALIHGWTLEKDVRRARQAFDRVRRADREPSTYEAMVRAHLAVEDREGAGAVVREALSRGYPAAVSAKIADLVGAAHV